MELKPGYKQTEAGGIPEDWKVIDLSNLCTLQRGFDLTEATKKTGTIPVYTSSGQSYFHNKAIVFPPGIVTGRKGILGKVFLINEPFWPHDTTLWVKDFKGNSPEFVKLVLENFHLERLDAATSVPTLNRNNLVGHLVAIPPTKSEQTAIATVLSDMDSYIESLAALITKKRLIKQGAMQELLTGKRRLPGFHQKPGYKQTEVGVIPEDWEVETLGDVCIKIQDGTHFSPTIRGEDYRYVTSKNIGFGKLDVTDVPRIDSAQHSEIYLRCDPKYGDLLLTKDGVNTGNAALNTLNEEFSMLSSVALLRFNPRVHNATYFLQQILSYNGQQRIKQEMSGNAITRLTLTKINRLKFPVCKLPEQTSIATVLSDMDSEIETLESKLSKARDLKQGMMQELLTGRIRLV